MKSVRKSKCAIVNIKKCVACGACAKVCPKAAITIKFGVYADINTGICAGCGLCAKACPASTISLEVRA